MIKNIAEASQLRGLARSRALDKTFKTVRPTLTDSLVSEGWRPVKKNKMSVRLAKKKSQGELLEDRVWMLFYRMGFKYLSAAGGAVLVLNPKDSASPTNQFDVVAIDDEVSVAVECKSSAAYSKRPQFQEELAKLRMNRERFATSVNQQYPANPKRHSVLVMVTENALLSENDRKRAEEAGVALLDEEDLAYYEGLVSHLGSAAKYQFLSELLPNKRIPGLILRVPAVRSKMGNVNSYTFTVTPSYLLKIAYVAHRAKGKASDVDTYQRMVKKSRLTKIRQYIEDDGIFPTNIVVNLDQKPNFQVVDSEAAQVSGTIGWLEIRPAYKSAWIIDGQHRLYAYSGLPQAENARLTVLAFEKLPASRQAALFIDINAQQKSVKQSLLQELYAELHWNSDDLEAKVQAIVSKVVQTLDDTPSSPFFRRILSADDTRTPSRCISLSSMYSAINRTDLYAAPARKSGPMVYGAFWAGDDSDETKRRSIRALEEWFQTIRDAVPEWWDAGSGDGGGLAMNDGVSSCIAVLRSVYDHLESNGMMLVKLDDDELVKSVEPFGHAMASYLASMTLEERRDFRSHRGVQGINTRTRYAQRAIQQAIPTFNPPGLQEWLDQQQAETGKRARDIIDDIEKSLQRTILDVLRGAYGVEDERWWREGVPLAVRRPVATRYEDDGGSRGGKEFYFDLIDYRSIMLAKWDLFSDIFGYTAAGAGKDKQTSWMVEVNEIRKIVMHASSGQSISFDQLALLERYKGWLDRQLVDEAPLLSDLAS